MAAQAARTRRSDLEMQARFPARLLRAPVPDRDFPEAGRAAVDLAEEKAPSSFSAAAAAARRRAQALRGRLRESMRSWEHSA